MIVLLEYFYLFHRVLLNNNKNPTLSNTKRNFKNISFIENKNKTKTGLLDLFLTILFKIRKIRFYLFYSLIMITLQNKTKQKL